MNETLERGKSNGQRLESEDRKHYYSFRKIRVFTFYIYLYFRICQNHDEEITKHCVLDYRGRLRVDFATRCFQIFPIIASPLASVQHSFSAKLTLELLSASCSSIGVAYRCCR